MPITEFLSRNARMYGQETCLTAEEIKYCLGLSETVALIFGPEFIDRVESIYGQIPSMKTLFFAGENRPIFAESYDRLTANCSSEDPQVELTDMVYLFAVLVI